jgi:hypothetical protein
VAQSKRGFPALTRINKGFTASWIIRELSDMI